jgi:hypothetical protein
MVGTKTQSPWALRCAEYQGWPPECSGWFSYRTCRAMPCPAMPCHANVEARGRIGMMGMGMGIGFYLPVPGQMQCATETETGRTLQRHSVQPTRATTRRSAITMTPTSSSPIAMPIATLRAPVDSLRSVLRGHLTRKSCLGGGRPRHGSRQLLRTWES